MPDPAARPKKVVDRPFIRWPGGKRRLAEAIIRSFPKRFSRYHEPFLGSGAIFFALGPGSALLSDMNRELINGYVIVRDEVEKLIAWLQKQEQSEVHYYRMRTLRPQDEIERAGRFLYLNRTAFNGIWRVNQKGEFNVPYGYRPRKDLVDADNLRKASTALRNATLRAWDYGEALAEVENGDLVYVDPPYTVRHENNGFRKYNETLFSWKDQQRLASMLHSLVNLGAAVVVSNAHSHAVRALYTDFREKVLVRSSRLAASVKARGEVKESLFACANDDFPAVAAEDDLLQVARSNYGRDE